MDVLTQSSETSDLPVRVLTEMLSSPIINARILKVEAYFAEQLFAPWLYFTTLSLSLHFLLPA